MIDIPNSAIQEIPEDDVLEDVTKTVGPCVIHLGVELGLDMPTIQDTLFKYPNDMRKQTLDVMKKWKISSEVKTICMLMKTFQSADSRGFKFLRKKYR